MQLYIYNGANVLNQLLQPLGCRLVYVGGSSSTADRPTGRPAGVTLFWMSGKVKKYFNF